MVTFKVALTTYQREEVSHLRDIAEGEAEADHNSPGDQQRWRQDLVAYNALLDGDDLDHEAAAILRPEIEWHRDKDFGPGHVRSMNNLLKKLQP